MSVKDKIRQILRQFRSKPNYDDPKTLKALYQYMNFITRDCRWYTDTYGKRFKYHPGGVWLINPETKEWVLTLDEYGYLHWYEDFYLNFNRYFNMEKSDYKKFIKLWVEDVLNREVRVTFVRSYIDDEVVEHILSIGKQLK